MARSATHMPVLLMGLEMMRHLSHNYALEIIMRLRGAGQLLAGSLETAFALDFLVQQVLGVDSLRSKKCIEDMQVSDGGSAVLQAAECVCHWQGRQATHLFTQGQGSAAHNSAGAEQDLQPQGRLAWIRPVTIA